MQGSQDIWPPPWRQFTPTIVDENDPTGDTAARRLLRKMLALKISRSHPDPMAAIEQAERDVAEV